ncbi:ExeA family protein [Shewanella sp. NIFS-20-20]|uniref:ExeA family protein n=1 Tax=Shewanella sp. NIFS-20-20 TaxID=2853806 RepID=UPI001C476AC9|nr:AAA family ATPase [Shewanella sp. NIFS-20-20]MBV7317379.1 AAA family ATPase [Shewanella sp. NIFS-20-20]
MYLRHFGFKQAPFTLTPNTEFYFGLPPHQEALQVLSTALLTGEGFIKVTGEVGTGKTLICRKLMNDMPDGFYCAYLPNPFLEPDELRWALAKELGLEPSSDTDRQQLSGLIQQQLLALAAKGLHIVLVLDEAQALPDQSLEALRLFTNLETETRKLIQVVLFGQPELDARLAAPAFRQLRQRITFSYCLRPLTANETRDYIHHRLTVAGNQSQGLFSPKVSQQVHVAARGIPRLINVICHKALLVCFGEGGHKVSPKHIKAAAFDTEDASPAGGQFWRWLAIFGCASLGLAVVSAWLGGYQL